jgi:hypothetical protein
MAVPFKAAVALPLIITASAAGLSAGDAGKHREAALVQTWGEALNSATATPVTKVVTLLKKMQETLNSEMNEDADLYDKLACWCNSNKHEKDEAITAAQAKIADLTSNIESLTARTSELKETIKELDSDVASNKQALAEATALREKEAAAFKGQETDSMQAVENLRAAIEVLTKHHGAALPQMSLNLPNTASFLAVRGKGRKNHDEPLFGDSDDHESRAARTFDEFLSTNGFTEGMPTEAPKLALIKSHTEVSTVADAAVSLSTYSTAETDTIQRAIKSASTFMQAKHSEDYYPSYNAQSGEIMGVLKELKDQMTGDLSESQQAELSRKEGFEALRSSKQAEIDAAHSQAEQKEDELAQAAMNLAESKEDIEQTTAALTEEQKFLLNLKDTCENADVNFEKRKGARLAEIQAVGEAISILTADQARDTVSRTYAFVQFTSSTDRTVQNRAKAAALLRGVATKAKNPELSILATTVELDTFGRVKKAIDDMVSMLKTQQSDEVKKNDWCNSELHLNEVAMTKNEDRKATLSSKADELGMTLKTHTDEIAAANQQIAQLQVDLQRASENRKAENMEFQTTIADQRATQAVLKQALEKLATFYDQEELLQVKGKQAPPVPQKEYNPNSGSSGVMQMIEKLIHEAKELEADSRKGEMQAQAMYEALIADTNASVEGLYKEVAFKTGEKAAAAKEKVETEADVVGTIDELEGLHKYDGELHSDCDYITKNFGTRQDARSQEIEALQQAKQILSGADLS